MGRIGDLLGKKKNILNVYCTAGYPYAESTPVVIRALEKYGADIVELGMPYSDPLADGPVIQESSSIALKNGMTIRKLLGELMEIKNTVKVPIVLMGYLNPVLQYGFEKFCADAAAAGVNGLIIPDLPVYEFVKFYQSIINNYNLEFIFLITPETSDDRIRQLDELSSGFLYAVSSSSITGAERSFEKVESYLQRITSMNLKNKVLVGFGIKDRSSFEMVCRYASGAIIGTAFINAIQNKQNIDEATKNFLSTIR